MIADSLDADSMAADSVQQDTTYVFVLEQEPVPSLPERADTGDFGMSWILTGLLLLFAWMAIRFSGNSKYLGALMRNAIEVRERGNAFDDTVRETSFVLLLNLMWTACIGVLLYSFIMPASGYSEGFSIFGLMPGALKVSAHGSPAMGMGICAGVTMLYMLFMLTAYFVVGNIFTDKVHTRMWVRGFMSATGLSTPVMFALALVVICYPASTQIALILAFVMLVFTKIVFIWKGFRIFFTQRGSWVLFLCYLCSLEIVPIVLLYVSAAGACEIML